MIKEIYDRFYQDNFSEYVVTTEFYQILREKCLEWEELEPDQFYIYLYLKRENVTVISERSINKYTSAIVVGFDYWDKSDVGVGPPRGRMSGYGDEHLYVKVI